MALHIKKITPGKMVGGRFVPNPPKRISKTKGRYLRSFGPSRGRLRSLLEKRRKPPTSRSVYGTKPNERYRVHSNGSMAMYTRTFEGAKRKGAKLARTHGNSEFFIQNNVTGSITTFHVPIKNPAIRKIKKSLKSSGIADSTVKQIVRLIKTQRSGKRKARRKR